jgi:hypothetical protein
MMGVRGGKRDDDAVDAFLLLLLFSLPRSHHELEFACFGEHSKCEMKNRKVCCVLFVRPQTKKNKPTTKKTFMFFTRTFNEMLFFSFEG